MDDEMRSLERAWRATNSYQDWLRWAQRVEREGFVNPMRLVRSLRRIVGIDLRLAKLEPSRLDEYGIGQYEEDARHTRRRLCGKASRALAALLDQGYWPELCFLPQDDIPHLRRLDAIHPRAFNWLRELHEARQQFWMIQRTRQRREKKTKCQRPGCTGMMGLVTIQYHQPPTRPVPRYGLPRQCRLCGRMASADQLQQAARELEQTIQPPSLPRRRRGARAPGVGTPYSNPTRQQPMNLQRAAQVLIAPPPGNLQEINEALRVLNVGRDFLEFLRVRDTQSPQTFAERLNEYREVQANRRRQYPRPEDRDGGHANCASCGRGIPGEYVWTDSHTRLPIAQALREPRVYCCQGHAPRPDNDEPSHH